MEQKFRVVHRRDPLGIVCRQVYAGEVLPCNNVYQVVLVENDGEFHYEIVATAEESNQ